MNILKNWQVTNFQLARELADGKIDEGIFEVENDTGIIGNVYGHPDFRDGIQVHTTAIRTIQRTKGAYMVTTAKGTVYSLPDAYMSPLPVSRTIHNWHIIFDTSTQDKFVRMFKSEFKKLILEKPTISEGSDYSVKSIAMPLYFHIAGTIDGKKVMIINDFGNVDRFTLEDGEVHFYFVSEDHHVEFELDDWNEDQALDFNIII